MKKVLVADESLHIRETIKNSLNGDCELLFLQKGKDLLGFLENSQTDIILLSYSWDGVQDSEILARLRECFPSMTIIVMSSIQDMEQKVRLLGANDFLLKPFDSAQLNKVLANHSVTH